MSKDPNNKKSLGTFLNPLVGYQETKPNLYTISQIDVPFISMPNENWLPTPIHGISGLRLNDRLVNLKGRTTTSTYLLADMVRTTLMIRSWTKEAHTNLPPVN